MTKDAIPQPNAEASAISPLPAAGAIPMNLIAAMDQNNGIGKNNDLPWRLPREYAHFVRQTTQTRDPQRRNAVILGRRCWESIPPKFRPLKDRVSVVLSRTMEKLIDIEKDVIVAGDLDEALRILVEHPHFAQRIETIWNAGGAEIYRLGLSHPWTHKLVLTEVRKTFEGVDTHFPPIPWNEFTANKDFDGTPVEEKGIEWVVTSYTRNATLFAA